MDPTTMIPLPSDNDWRATTQLDPDTRRIHDTLLHNTPVLRAQLNEKAYHELLQAHHFELQWHPPLL